MFTDRSRMEAYQRCPRSRWWGYHQPFPTTNEEGLIVNFGLRSKAVQWDLVIGSAVHKGVEVLLHPYCPSPVVTDITIDDAVNAALNTFDIYTRDEVNDIEEETGNVVEGDYFTYTLRESRALVEALVRVFYLSENGLRGLLRRYNILEVEHEEPVQPLTTTGIVMGGKCDGLLEDKVTKDLYILSLKTTGLWDSRKSDAGRTDMQGKSESFLVESRLGRKIEGVQYVYLVKGGKRKDESTGIYKNQSTLIHPYKKVNSPLGGEYFHAWTWTDETGSKRSLNYKSHKRCDIWEEPIGLEGWIEKLYHTYTDEFRTSTALEEHIITPEPYYRDDKEINDWKEQITQQEYNIQQGILAFQDGILSKDMLLNWVFPQYTHSCSYPLKCRYYSVCHEMGGNEEQALNGGMFIPRQPHHQTELVHLMGVNVKIEEQQLEKENITDEQEVLTTHTESSILFEESQV